MADIELVIKIPNEAYNLLKTSGVDWLGAEHILDAVANGTPLPEGHGRIADMDEAIKCIEDCEGEDAIWAIALIEWACGKRTIIEADKTERDVNLDEPYCSSCKHKATCCFVKACDTEELYNKRMKWFLEIKQCLKTNNK